MRRPSARQVASCFWRALVNTINHDGIEHAGYLAFLGLLALFPFLVFVVSLIGFIGQGEAGTALIGTLLEAMPDSLTNAIRPRIVEIISGPPQGLLTLSILGAIWTASSAVEGIRTVLNRAYHVQAPPAYWLRRSLSILQLLVFTFVAITAMLLVVSAQVLAHELGDWLDMHFTPDALGSLKQALGGVLLGAVFAAVGAIYYTIPNIRQRFVAVLPGAALVVLGWYLAADLLASYLTNFHQMNVIYGSLGGFIAALVFLYLCNVVFIYGAEFNYLFSLCIGLRISRTADAVDAPPEPGEAADRKLAQPKKPLPDQRELARPEQE